MVQRRRKTLRWRTWWSSRRSSAPQLPHTVAGGRAGEGLVAAGSDFISIFSKGLGIQKEIDAELMVAGEMWVRVKREIRIRGGLTKKIIKFGADDIAFYEMDYSKLNI